MQKASPLSAGPTPLFRHAALSRRFGNHVFVKDESANEFSQTHKDRRSAKILEEAVRNGIRTLVQITYGNAGISLGRMNQAVGTNLDIINVVPYTVDDGTMRLLEESKTAVAPMDLSRQRTAMEIIAFCRSRFRRLSREKNVWNVSNGWACAYHSIADEILNQMPSGHPPHYMVAPVGSGELMMGLYEGIERRGLRTILTGVAATRQSIADKLSPPCTPYEGMLRTITRYEHRIIRVGTQDIRRSMREAPNDLVMEASASVVLAGLDCLHGQGKNVVLINTGCGPASRRI